MKLENKNGFTQLTCEHAVAFAERREATTGLAAPMMDGIELEPGTLFMCCSWCAAFVQNNALEALLKKGVIVTLTPPVPEKPPTLCFDDTVDALDAIVKVEWRKARQTISNPLQCRRFTPENAADSEPKSYCRLPAGHGCSCVFHKK